MRSGSSKHSSGIDVDVPKNTFNIKPFKKIDESKSRVSIRKEEVKKKFTSTTPQRMLKRFSKLTS